LYIAKEALKIPTIEDIIANSEKRENNKRKKVVEDENE
jgi:hypothetical protein